MAILMAIVESEVRRSEHPSSQPVSPLRGLFLHRPLTHSLRCGLHSFAASGLSLAEHALSVRLRHIRWSGTTAPHVAGRRPLEQSSSLIPAQLLQSWRTFFSYPCARCRWWLGARDEAGGQ